MKICDKCGNKLPNELSNTKQVGRVDMTLDEIISNAEFCANEYKKFSEIAPERSLTFKKYEEDHRQLAEWLKDYKRLKEQEPCEDVISRQAVLDEAFEVDTSVWSEDAGGERMTLDEAIEHEEEVAEINQAIADNTDDDNWMDIAQCEKCAAEHKQLAAWLKELMLLREQTRWIPVSERLPGDSGTYLVTVHDGRKKRTTFAQYQKKLKNWVMTGARAYWRVKAWMPFPEPYQSEIPTGSEGSGEE